MPNDAQQASERRARARDVEYKAPKDYAGRLEAEQDLGVWLKRYMPEAFPLEWADFHLVAIRKLQVAFTQGGNFALALPRGSGKTTLCKGAILWAVLSGHKKYFLALAATGKKADAIIKDIKAILRFNDILAQDYPEVCMPIRELKGVAMKAHAQTAFGEPTMIEWQAGQLVLPSTPRVEDGKKVKSVSSGSIIQSCGITGDVRGAQFTTQSGVVLRPDGALCDDPQTKESAKSPDQTETRLGVIMADVAGSEGTVTPISVVITCTIIRRGDLADQALDPELYPDFRGECHSMLNKLPDNMDLWHEYNEVRVKGLNDEDGGKKSNEFYLANREALDGDIICSWSDRKLDKVSAIQGAMDKYFKFGHDVFMAEYMNDPAIDASLYTLDEKIVMGATNGLERRTAPDNAQTITAFVDINRAGLHWCICAFSHPLTGYVMDYGKWPVRGDLWEKNANQVERHKKIIEGLNDLVNHFDGIHLSRGEERTGLNLLMVDEGYEPDAVQQWLRFAKTGYTVMAARGISHHKYDQGHKSVVKSSERDGCHKADSRGRQFIAHDACRWREFSQRGFLSAPGTPGSVSLYGSRGKDHQSFATHIVAETLSDIAIGTKGDKVYRWGGVGDHDWLDALEGCLVGASWLGFTMSGEKEVSITIRRPRKRGVK